MRLFIALPLVTFSLGIAAEPTLHERGPTLVERDIPTITNILLAVGSGISTLDLAVQAFTSDSSTIDSDSSALQNTIASGIATVEGSGDLSLQDAISLAAPVTALQALGASLVNDLIAQKSAFEANGLCEDISSQVTGIQTTSQNLINAIVALVPAAAQGLAASLAAPFEASLAEGVAAFASSNCTDATTSSVTVTSSSIPVQTSSSPVTTSSSPATASSSPATISSTSNTPSSIPVPISSSSVQNSSSSITTSSSSSPTTSSVRYFWTSNTACTASISTPLNATTPTTTLNATKPTTTLIATKPAKTSAAGSGGGAATHTSSSTSVAFTGAAHVNYATNSFGILALAAAAALAL